MKKVFLVICLCTISLEIYLLPLIQYINKIQGVAYYENIYTYIIKAPYNIAFTIPTIVIFCILIKEMFDRWARPFVKKVEDHK